MNFRFSLFLRCKREIFGMQSSKKKLSNLTDFILFYFTFLSPYSIKIFLKYWTLNTAYMLFVKAKNITNEDSLEEFLFFLNIWFYSKLIFLSVLSLLLVVDRPILKAATFIKISIGHFGQWFSFNHLMFWHVHEYFVIVTFYPQSLKI